MRTPSPQPSYYNLNVRVPSELHQLLRERAARERNGLSAVARRLLARALSEESASEGQQRG